MIKKFASQKLLCSIIFVFFSFFLCFILNSFTISTSGDDYGMYFFIKNGDYKNLFVNYFLLAFLIPIQRLIPNINSFVTLELIMNIISFTAIYYVFLSLKKIDITKKIVVLFVISILFSSFAFVHLQWTITSAINATAGYILLLYSMQEDFFCKRNIFCLVFSVLLLLYSSMLRIESYIIVTAVFAIFTTCVSIEKFSCKFCISKRIFSSVISAFRNSWKIILSFIIIFMVLFSLNFVSNNIKSSIDGFNEYKIYNCARSNLVDYDFAPYVGNESFYNSIDIYSQNDLDVYKSWCLDSDFFTTERMQKIGDYSVQPELGLRFSFLRIFNIIKNKLTALIPINPVISVIILLLFGIFIFCVMLKYRHKLRIMFPILFTLMWFMFFFVFRIKTENILIFFFAVVSSITVYFYDFKYFIRMSGISLFIIAMYLYLVFNRPIFRAVFTFAFPAIIIMIFLIFIMKKTVAIHTGLNISKKYLMLILTIFSIFSVVCGVNIWGSEVKNKDHSNIYNYCINNPTNLYVSGPGHGMSTWFNDKDNALLSYEIPKNVIITGWIDGSEYDLNLKRKYDVVNLYESIVNRDSIYYITTKECADKLTKYYNDHYAGTKENISFIRVDELGNNAVYKIVSSKNNR